MAPKRSYSKNDLNMEGKRRKRTRRVLHYDEYVVETYTSKYTVNELELIKHAHDSLNFCIPILLKEGILTDISTFFDLVGSNTFPMDNIAFLLFLDIIRFYSVESATQMRYSKDTYLFWMYGYLLLKGRFLRFMGGTKFKGTILDGSSDKGSFSPEKSRINFIVPSENSLRNETELLGMPKIIKPGMIDLMLNSLKSNSKHVVLSCDGKLIRRGLTEDSGDVDLQGSEESPTLEERKNRLMHEINLVRECEDDIQTIIAASESDKITDILPADRSTIQKSCQKMLSILAHRNCDVRAAKLKKEYTVQKIMKSLEDPDWRKSRYCHLISQLNYECSKMEKYLSASLNDAKDISLLLREMSGSKIPTSVIESGSLELQSNIVELTGQKTSNPLHIKQGTDEWLQMRKQAPVTGSTLYDAIGMRSLKNQREHIDRYVNDKEKLFDDDTKKLLDWGRNNEGNAVATLVAYGLPVAEQPSIFAEVGCSFIPSPSNGRSSNFWTH